MQKQEQIDQYIEKGLAKRALLEQRAKEIIETGVHQQTTVDALLNKQQENNVKSPYTNTFGYQQLLYYTSQLPLCIGYAMMYGTFDFIGIGLPDENLIKSVENYCQTYVATYYPELQATIVPPQYQAVGTVYKSTHPAYSLIIQKKEKTK